MRRVTALLLLTCCAAGACRQAEPANMTADEVAGELADIRIEPGLWLLTSEVTDVRAPNLPVEVRNRMIGPRARMRHCITPEQAAQPSANFLAMRAESDCAYRDFRLEEGRLSGTMTCPNVTARMEGRYGTARYETRMVMESPVPGGAMMTLHIRAQGRRIGDCMGEKAK